MNSQSDGALIVVGLEAVNTLAIYLGRVVIEVLLHVKHVLTKSGEVYRLENMVNALVTQRLIDLLLCLKVDLLLIVINPGEPLHHGTEVFIEHRRLVCADAGHENPQHNE